MVSTRLQKILYAVIMVVIPICLALFFVTQYPNLFKITDSSSLVIIFNGKAPLRVTVAESMEDRIQGLSGRASLEPTEGLLFVFPEDGYHGIWMKDMRFPIDIMWIDAGGTVISIEENVRPETFPQTFEPARPARYVVEANAYYFSSFKVQVGDTVAIPGYIEKR